MKKTIIFIILVVIFILCLLLVKYGRYYMFKKKITNIIELEYGVFSGRAINDEIIYKLKCSDNKCVLESCLYGMSRDDSISVEVNEESLNKIIDVLNEVNVYSWNGFNKVDKYVLDGESFDFNLKTDKDTISLSGYMKYPKGFSTTMNKLKNIFTELNKKVITKLYDYELYKDIKKEEIVKVIDYDKEYTDEYNINRMYDNFDNIYLVYKEDNDLDDDYMRIIKFIMKDGKEYIIKEKSHYIIIDNYKYVYNYIS